MKLYTKTPGFHSDRFRYVFIYITFVNKLGLTIPTFKHVLLARS